MSKNSVSGDSVSGNTKADDKENGNKEQGNTQSGSKDQENTETGTGNSGEKEPNNSGNQGTGTTVSDNTVSDNSTEKAEVYWHIRFFDSDGETMLLPEITVQGSKKEIKDVISKSVNIVRNGYQVVWDRYRLNAKGKRVLDTGDGLKPHQTVSDLLSSGRNIKRDYDFIACWGEVPYYYEIDYELNGGSFKAADVKARTIVSSFSLETADIPFPIPEKTGYVFKGWFKEESFKNEVTCIPRGTIGPDSNEDGSVPHVVFYAKWERAPLSAPQVNFLSYEGKGKVSFDFDSVDLAAGYEISFSTKKDFSANVNTIIDTDGGTSVFTNLLKKKYFFRVRAFEKQADGSVRFGDWSETRKVKVKQGVSEVKAKTGLLKIKQLKVKNGNLFVKIKANKRLKSDDETYYLVKCNPSTGKLKKKNIIAKLPKSKVSTSYILLDDKTKADVINGSYALAIKKGGKYKRMSEPKSVKGGN